MGRFTKLVVAGLAAAMLAAGGAFADFMVDDLEHGSNQHYLNNYWYFYVYDESDILEGLTLAKHNSVITNAGPADADGPMSFKAFEGDSRTGSNGSYCAALEFDKLSVPVALDYAGVAMAFNLTTEVNGVKPGYGAEFNNVNEVEFWARSADPLSVRFRIATSDEAISEYNTYMYTFNTTAAWTKFNVKLKPVTPAPNPGAAVPSTGAAWGTPDLKQSAGWGKQYTFAPQNATELHWVVAAQDNEGVASSKLYVDDVRFVGPFTYIAKDECPTCVGKPRPTPNVKLSDFENEDALMNALSFYWYPYMDDKAGGRSGITGDWTINPYNDEEILDVKGNGNNGSNGVKIEFEMGGQFDDCTGMGITSFVGIGVNLFDVDNGNKFLNVPAATGISFDYKTTNIKDVAVEFTDDLDNTVEAGGPCGGGDGVVWYTKVPGTGGQWKSAVILFTDLVQPLWIKSTDRRYNVKLKNTALAKIQFKYQGATNGSIALDNVYFLGIDKFPNIGVTHVSNKAKAAGLRATYSRGVVGVNWNTATQIASGKITLINTKGRVIASAPIAKTADSKVTAKLGAKTVPTGMYFVRINAKDVNGKKIVQQAPISIVK